MAFYTLFFGALTGLATFFMAVPGELLADDQANHIPYLGKMEGKPGEGVLPDRLALVIGINRYNSPRLPIGDLTNAEDDAEAVADELQRASFDVIRLTTTRKEKSNRDNNSSGNYWITRNEIMNAISSLINYAAKPSAGRPPVVLIYFAGHGISVRGEDYILPSDFAPSFVQDVPEMAIRVSDIVRRLSWANPAAKIIISDACRSSDAGSLVDRETNIAEQLARGHKQTRFDRPPGQRPPRGIDDTMLVFTTLPNDTASDGSENQPHGKYAAALISVLRKSYKKVILPNGKSAETEIRKIFSKVASSMDPAQQPDTVGLLPSDFLLYPTEEDYNLERKSWKDSTEKSLSPGTPDDLRKQVYCNTRQFLDDSSFYGYFGAAALSQLTRYEDPGFNCNEPPTLKTSASESEVPKFQKPLEGWTTTFQQRPTDGALTPKGDNAKRRLTYNDLNRLTDQRFAFDLNLAEATKLLPFLAHLIDDLRIKDLDRLGIDPAAQTDLRSFSEQTRIDDLATVAADTVLFQDRQLQKIKGVLNTGDLVKLLGVVNKDTLKLQTFKLVEGYVKAQSIDKGWAAVTFNVGIDTGGNITFATRAVDQLLRSSVVSDMLVKYPAEEKLEGYSQAQTVAAKLFAPVGPDPVDPSRVIERNVARILPAEPSEGRTNPSFKLNVTAMLLPLVRNDRLRFNSASGHLVNPSQALDLDAANNIRISSLTGENSGPPWEEVDIFHHSKYPARKCLDAVASTPGSKTIAYVQFARDDQKTLSDTLRLTLKVAGFDTPSAEKVKSAPRQSEVRVCADQNLERGRQAVNILQKCSFGKFKFAKIGPCRTKASPTDSIEVWLSSHKPKD